MGHSETTPEEKLPVFSSTDKPAWLGDINPAFGLIDRAFSRVKRRITTLEIKVRDVASQAVPRLMFTVHDEPSSGRATVDARETPNGYVIDLGMPRPRDANFTMIDNSADNGTVTFVENE